MQWWKRQIGKFLAEEGIRQLYHDTRSITRFRITSHRPTVFHIPQDT
jgi:hypothetical protein